MNIHTYVYTHTFNQRSELTLEELTSNYTQLLIKPTHTYIYTYINNYT